MIRRNPKRVRSTDEVLCYGCGEPVLVAITLVDGRSLRRHPGRGGRIFCSTNCRVRDFRRRRKKA